MVLIFFAVFSELCHLLPLLLSAIGGKCFSSFSITRLSFVLFRPWFFNPFHKILQRMTSSVSDVNVSLPLSLPPIEPDSFNFSALVWPASQHLLWLVKLLFPLGGTLAYYPFTSFKTYNQKFIQKLITSWTFCLFLRLLSNVFCVQPQKSWFSKYGLHLMPPWLISFALAVCLPPFPFFESVLKNHQWASGG